MPAFQVKLSACASTRTVPLTHCQISGRFARIYVASMPRLALAPVTLLCIGRLEGLDRPDSRQKQFFFLIAIQAAHPYRSARESVPMHSICVWQSYNHTSRTARNTWCAPSKLEILRTHTISDRREEFRTPRA